MHCSVCWFAGLLFDWLYPAHFPVISCCLEAWADTPEVTTALLRFMAEFVMNKNTRLAFDSSSPNGILLFREVSKVYPSWLCLSFQLLAYYLQHNTPMQFAAVQLLACDIACRHEQSVAIYHVHMLQAFITCLQTSNDTCLVGEHRFCAPSSQVSAVSMCRF